MPFTSRFLYYFLFFFSVGTMTGQSVVEEDAAAPKSFFHRIAVNVSVANRPQSLRNLYAYSLDNFTEYSLGDFSVHYRLNDNLALGAGSIGGLGNCDSGFLEPGGEFRFFHRTPAGDCRSRDLSSLMVFLTTVPDEIPAYVQFAVGHSFFDHAAAYAFAFGLRQKVLPGTYVTFGLRETEVFHRYPAGVEITSYSDGLRLELGISWFR